MRERNLNGKEMMEKCKHCAGNKLIKNGFEKSKQRYKCKCCKRTCREGDERVKYTLEKKIRVLKWYLEGAGIRSIERMEEVSATLIVYWIRKMGSMLREKIESTKVPEKAKDVEILEVDELFSYCQKNFQSVRMACC
jgi:transposase-like protein